MELANKLFKGDRSVWIIFMLLCLVSLVEVYSATSTLAYRQAHFWTPIMRHAGFLFFGFCGVLLVHNIPSKYFSVGIGVLLLSIILLFVTPIIGVRLNDAHRWINIFGIQFQPSEVAKISCILFVAFMLSKQERFNPDRTFWIIVTGVALTCGLILPDNFSTSALLGLVCFIMMFIGQVPMKKMLKLTAVLVILGALAFTAIRFVPEKYLPDRLTTWQERISDFGKDDKEAVFEDDFQVNHAKIAIANGGFWGVMPGNSKQRDILPQAFSDFIYAIIIEEMGLIIGGIGVLLLYIMLMFRVAIIARRCEKLFPKYLVLGCGLIIVIQAFINMAVAVNLIPVTGQPLPLISRGGTSTVLTCIYFGIILSVSRFGAGMGNEEDDAIEETADATEAADAVKSTE
ncbi:MAG: FtsW/RodA/SpoVE family cell cycle protein [Tannerella sp.]|jgi:cell division protein FtsW|nr:FtsW/RodA/SpoVE family cell cycle protein [Tannerella sp.]